MTHLGCPYWELCVAMAQVLEFTFRSSPGGERGDQVLRARYGYRPAKISYRAGGRCCRSSSPTQAGPDARALTGERSGPMSNAPTTLPGWQTDRLAVLLDALDGARTLTEVSAPG